MPKAKEEEEAPRILPPWHCMSKEEVFKKLEVPNDIRRKGLTSAQANERLEKYGENQMSEKEKETLLQKIWKLVANVLVGILVFVAIISAISAVAGVGDPLQNWIQVGIIAFVIV
jgi:Ca2+-transporting ATPase